MRYRRHGIRSKATLAFKGENACRFRRVVSRVQDFCLYRCFNEEIPNLVLTIFVPPNYKLP